MTAPTFTLHLTNINAWGQNAPTSLGYTFDKYYYQKTDSVSGGFSASNAGFSFDASITATYNLEFGLKTDLNVSSGTMNVDYAFQANASASPIDQVIDQAPQLYTSGAVNGPSQIEAQGSGATNFDFIMAAAAAVDLSAHIGFSFPTNPGSSWDGTLLQFQGGDKRQLTLSQGDTYNAESDYGVSVTATVPQGLQGTATTSQYGTFTEQASDSFLSANLDLDKLLKAFDVPTQYISGGESVDAAGLGSGSITYNVFNAFLNAGASITETHSATPDVNTTVATANLQIVDESLSRAVDLAHMASFGQTLTGKLGDAFTLATPEGEGTFDAHMTYDAYLDITSVFGIALSTDFNYQVLAGSITASIVGNSISADYALVNNTIPLAGTTVPIHSETDAYFIGEQQDTVSVAFEKFRTTQGSGDNFTLTTHQVTANGNNDANTIQGNALDNTISGGGGNDHLMGMDGSDTLHGGDGADFIEGGSGNDFIYGDAGNDILMPDAGDATVSTNGNGPIVDGGDDNDIIIGGSGFHNSLFQAGGLIILAGGNGADRIVSGSADEELHGGPSDSIEGSGTGNQSDTFVFAPGCGHDDIWDINSLQRTSQGQNDPYLIDTIDLTAFTQYHSFDDLVAAGCFRTDPLGRVEIVLDVQNWPSSYNDSISFDGVYNGADFKDIVKKAHWLFAGMDPSAINGTPSDDVLLGGPTAETLNGSSGNDVINGGSGGDKLIGGSGSDDFVLDRSVWNDAVNKGIAADIVDYNQGGAHYDPAEVDYIDVSGAIQDQNSIASEVVRAVTDPSGAHVLLQMDADGADNGQQWTTVAALDNVQASHGINVQYAPASGPFIPGQATTLSVFSNDGRFGDFDGDDKADLVWRNDDGVVAIWKMDGGTVTNGFFLAGVSSDWHIVGTGDFNGDHKTDILWQNDNGALLDWQMNSSSQIGGTIGLGSAPAGSVLAGIGDMDHDGKSDLIWRDGTSGAVTVNTMAGASATLNGVNNDWSVVGIGDYNGDGNADIMFRNASQGVNAAWLMNGATLSGAVFYSGVPNDWHVVASGDFNGDGTADLFWHNDNGGNAVWLMDHGGNVQSSAFFDGVGSEWHVAGVGDFNGDHRDDVVWHAQSGATAIWLMNGASTPAVAFPGGAPTDWMTNTHHYDYV